MIRILAVMEEACLVIESFVLHQPDSLPAALTLLAGTGGCRVLAWRQRAHPALKMNLAAANHVVNIKKIPGLGRLDYERIQKRC